MKWQVLFLVFILASGSVWAGEVVSEAAWEMSLNMGYFSHYMGSYGATFHDDPVFQGSVALTSPWDVYAVLWASYSPDGGFNSDFGDEIDYVIGYSRGFGTWNAGISYARYNVIELKDTEGDIGAVCFSLSYAGIVEPYLGIDGNIPMDKEILPGGWTWKLGAKKGFDLGSGLSVGADIYAAGNDGAFGKDPELLSVVGLKGNVGWQINPALSLAGQLGYQYRVDQDAENSIVEAEKVFGSVSLSYSFGF